MLVDAGQSAFAAVERVQNVAIGGLVGMAFVLGVHGVERARRRGAA